ncbi:undecaprenyl-diphosphate phosphatase [Candidatus Omnitrophota bacterium]
MNVIKYIFLGIIQGLTEFLPVSSSAHLVIFQEIFAFSQNQLLLDIVLHLGTLLAVIVFLIKDIRSVLNPKMLLKLFLVTVLTGAVVLLGQGFFERLFVSTAGVILPLIITGLILLASKKFTQGQRRMGDLKISDALWLGIVQGLAVIPGISRSGVTISTLLFRNVEKETAFKFSFLASILAILGALFLKLQDFSQISVSELGYMGLGFVASFLSGLIALKVLLAVIRGARLHLFGYYCIALGLLLWGLLR